MQKRTPLVTVQQQQFVASFDAAIAAVDPRQNDCKQQISVLRGQLDDAYASHNLSLHQFRMLWEEVSIVQARHAILQADSWRVPRQEGEILGYVPPPPKVLRR